MHEAHLFGGLGLGDGGLGEEAATAAAGDDGCMHFCHLYSTCIILATQCYDFILDLLLNFIGPLLWEGGGAYFCPLLFPPKMTRKCDIKGSGICSPLPPLIRTAGWEHLFWKKGKKIRVYPLLLASAYRFITLSSLLLLFNENGRDWSPGESYQIICSRSYQIWGLHYVFLPWQDCSSSAHQGLGLLEVCMIKPQGRRPWALMSLNQLRLFFPPVIPGGYLVGNVGRKCNAFWQRSKRNTFP